MNGKYEAAAIAVKNAEKALETLKDFADIQYKAKGETMREQIADYIANVLADAQYIRGCSCMYHNLSLSRSNDGYIFYVEESPYLSFRTPIFSINTSGQIQYLRELKEETMLIIAHYWDGFKDQLDFSIKVALEERTKSINKKIAHIAYVNEQLSKWKV